MDNNVTDNKLLTTGNLPSIFREEKKYVDSTPGCDCTGDGNGGGSSSGGTEDSACYIVLDEINILNALEATEDKPMSLEKEVFYSIINKCKEALNSCKRLVTAKVTDEAGTVSRYEIISMAINLDAGIAQIRVDYANTPYLVTFENNLTCYATKINSNEGGDSTSTPAPAFILLNEFNTEEALLATADDPLTIEPTVFKSIVTKCVKACNTHTRLVMEPEYDGADTYHHEIVGIKIDEDETPIHLDLLIYGKSYTMIFDSNSCYTVVHSNSTASLDLATEAEVKGVADEVLDNH